MILDIATHKSKLIQILKDMFQNSTVGPVLGFKGGTAAYLFYDLNRFSVDLDFDLLDKTKEDIVFKQVSEVLQSYGTLKEAHKKRYTLFYFLAYYNKIEGAQNIKVEISRRSSDSRYDVKSYLGIPMNVMVREDMFAHKLLAMAERLGKANRDIFDVWFFFKHDWPINQEIIAKQTGGSFKTFLQKVIPALEKMTDENILDGIGELLTPKQKVWAKVNLLSETIFLLQLKLSSEPGA